MAKAKAAEKAVEENKELATAQTTELSAPEFGYDDFAGSGFENQTSSDMSIPFLSVLQALSPQVAKEAGDGGIEGAKAGMLYNSVTEEIWSGKEGVYFVPATTQHGYCEYVPRKRGGGFKGMYETNSQYVADAMKSSGVIFGKIPVGQVDKDGVPETELVETFSIYGIICDDFFNPVGPCVLAFTSTKIKAYKSINTKLRTFQVPSASNPKVKITPPMFAHRLKITSFGDSNTNGDFFNVRATAALNGPDGEPNLRSSLLPTSHPAFLAAKALKESVDSGAAKANFQNAEAQQTEGGNVPF